MRGFKVDAVCVLIVVVVLGGNFLLLRNQSTRSAGAADDASRPAAESRSDAGMSDEQRAWRRERAAEIIARRLPDASEDERGVWLEEIGHLQPFEVEELFDLRQSLAPQVIAD
jgi:hypothetical protein